MSFKGIFTLTAFKIGILATILSLIVYAVGVPFLSAMELKAYDFHFLYRGKVDPGKEVAIVAVDQKSIDSLGRWPWPRTRISELIERLNDGGAKVIAFDMIFSEPDDSLGLGAIRGLKKRLRDKGRDVRSEIDAVEKMADSDARLASVLKKSPSVILGYFFFTSKEEIGHTEKQAPYLIPSRYSSVRYLEKPASLPDMLTAAGVEENIGMISDAARDFGYFNIIPDVDGTVRWVPLAVRYRDDFYPHLSIESVRKYLGSPPLLLNVAGYGVDSIQIGDRTLPVDERGRLLINYRGPQKTFPHYSFSDVLSGEVPADAFKDRIVLVGATAIGIYDMRVTPFSGTFPGVEIHANVIDNILKGDFVNRPDWIVVFDVLAILLLGVSISAGIPRVRAVYATMFTVTFSGLYILLNNYIFYSWNIWLTTVYPLLTIIFVSACVITYQFWTEERKRRQVKDAFSRYVAPSLINEILKDPDKLVLGGEERRLTVLFSDIRGFTTISEKLKPQELVKLMNDYLTPMTDIILKHGGTIDKYMGDAIMAFWGAPLWQDDHAYRACGAALDMIKRLHELQIQWEKAGLPRIDIGVGISTGKVTVGNMGSTTRFDYTVMGDTVNLGSRLEGLNKEYGTHIIITKYTHDDIEESLSDRRERLRRGDDHGSRVALERRLLKDRRLAPGFPKGEFLLRPLDLIKVKGKVIPIEIYELMGDVSESERLRGIVERFEAGLGYYWEKKWDLAEESFNKALELRPDDGPSRVFLERIKELRKAELPPDWDGVFVMTKK